MEALIVHITKDHGVSVNSFSNVSPYILKHLIELETKSKVLSSADRLSIRH